MDRRRFLTAGVTAVAGFALAGCPHLKEPPGREHASRGSGRGWGPPPHAPAHGYRRKHRRSGAELVFDSGLGVYVVVGLPVYFAGERFYRLGDAGWEISVDLDGPWRAVAYHAVPPKLVAAKGRGNGRGKGKAKGWSKSRGNGKGKDWY